MTNKAIYTMSGDPIHNGHVNSIATAVKSGLFEKIYLGLGVNPTKKYLFNTDERVYLAKKAICSAGLADKVEVEAFSGLARNYAAKKGIEVIVKGARNSQDFDYEKQMAEYHSRYGLTTFILPSDKNTEISSTLVKAIVQEAGMTDEYVHPAVKQALEERLRGYSLIGVTGNIGCGKTTLCRQIVEQGKDYGLKINHVDFDKLVHSLYSGNDGLSDKVLSDLRTNFGDNIFEKERLDTRKLAGIVFGDDKNRKTLADILMMPAIAKLEETLREMKGIVLVDAAYFTEYNMLPLVNYNTILVSCDEDERYQRLLKRENIAKAELEAKVKSQHSQELKKKIIEEAQKKQDYGFFYEFDTSNNSANLEFMAFFEKLNKSFPLFR